MAALTLLNAPTLPNPTATPALTNAPTPQTKADSSPLLRPAASTTGKIFSATATADAHDPTSLLPATPLPIAAPKPVASHTPAPTLPAQTAPAPHATQPLPAAKLDPQTPTHATPADTTPGRPATTSSEHNTPRDGSDPHRNPAAQQDAGTTPTPAAVASPLTAATLAATPQATAAGTPATAATLAPTTPTNTPASTPALATAEPAPTAPMGRVEVARLLHTAAGSELRVGMQTDEFGAISIRTALGRDQLSAHISLDADRLGSATLSTHLSSLQDALAERLGQNLGVKTSISVGAELASQTGSQTGSQTTSQTTSQTSHGNNSPASTGGNANPGNNQAQNSSRQQRESPYRAAGLGGDFAASATPLGALNQPARSGRLDIRI